MKKVTNNIINNLKPLPKAVWARVLLFLETLGVTALQVGAKFLRDCGELSLLTLKLVWEKTVIFRTKIVNIAKYLFVFVASPFVKLSINVGNMKRDMKNLEEERGKLGAALACLPYVGKFVFGKRGLVVTGFNYAAPILSVIFLFNIIGYATSSNFSLKLTVNGEFYGYIANEQVFLDAENFVNKRVNYYGSTKTIEIYPEFSIANIGTNELMTMNEVANLIMERADFNRVRAYGFFIDNALYGAVHVDEIHLIDEKVAELFAAHSGNDPNNSDEEIGFLNHVVWDELDWFLEESVVPARDIISLITSTDRSTGEPRLPIRVTRTEIYEEYADFDTEYVDDPNMLVGQSNTVQQGRNGISRITARVSYINGEEIQRRITQSVHVSEPVTRIIRRGTKPLASGDAPPRDPVEYGMFIWPVDGGYISSPYGWRWGRMHNGVDIAAPYGTRVFAAGNGVVILAQYDYGSYGHTIIIQHDDGKQTLYSHNSALSVTVGQQVSQGQYIANIGQTGNARGNHLHFEVREGNIFRNPTHYLPR